MGKTVYYPDLKSILRHSPFYFLNSGVYFVSIGRMVPKNRAKIFFFQLWNQVYGICRSIFRTFEVILGRLDVWFTKIRAKAFIIHLWNQINGIRCSIFKTLEVILRWLEVPLAKCGWNRLFSGFKHGLEAFAVLFLEHWRLFCVNWKYGCEDTGENVCLMVLK